MKKIKPIGYIVVPSDKDHGRVYKLGAKGTDKAKSLWFGSGATLFTTRKRAATALKNTKKYRDEHGYRWEWIDTSYILAVYAQ